LKTRDTVANLGEYVPGKKRAGTVKLSSNENPLGPAPRALEAISEWASALNVYPDGSATELRDALASRAGVERGHVIVGNGSDEVLVMLAATFLNPGEHAVIPEHTFSQYEFATRLYDGKPVYAPMRDGRIQLDAMRELIDADTRLVFVCNPNNPTGTYIPGKELAAFAHEVPDDVLLIIDEAYCEFADAPDFSEAVALTRERENVIVLRTFSKLYGLASLRVGYGIAAESVIASMHKVKPPFNTGLLAQKAATAALSDEEFVEQTLSNNREQRAVLRETLERLGMPQYPSEANFICADCGGDAQEFAAELADEGVSVRPLSSFGMPTRVRISVGTAEQNRMLAEALERVHSRQATSGKS